MILLIDNYDSFTYNLYQFLGEINPDIKVVRNDKITLNAITQLNPSRIVLSPGPGHPKDAGIIVDLYKELGAKYKILGICLGHQAMGLAYNAQVKGAEEIMHGKSDIITIDNKEPIFDGLPEKIKVGRYHSLAVYDEPNQLKIIGRDKKGLNMAMRHSVYENYGLQFHPESILTEHGKKILNNFLR